jgi:hypothetical protein
LTLVESGAGCWSVSSRKTVIDDPSLNHGIVSIHSLTLPLPHLTQNANKHRNSPPTASLSTPAAAPHFIPGPTPASHKPTLPLHGP